MQGELQKQWPKPGVGEDQATKQYNQLLNSAETRSQGLIDQYALTHGPQMADALKQRLSQVFGKYRVGEEGPGVTTNAPNSGLTNGTQNSPQHIALARQIMTDPEAGPDDKAWAQNILGVK